jgi:hypothetical protein
MAWPTLLLRRFPAFAPGNGLGGEDGDVVVNDLRRAFRRSFSLQIFWSSFLSEQFVQRFSAVFAGRNVRLSYSGQD